MTLNELKLAEKAILYLTNRFTEDWVHKKLQYVNLVHAHKPKYFFDYPTRSEFVFLPLYSSRSFNGGSLMISSRFGHMERSI